MKIIFDLTGLLKRSQGLFKVPEATLRTSTPNKITVKKWSLNIFILEHKAKQLTKKKVAVMN